MNIFGCKLDSLEKKIKEAEKILVILLDQGKPHFLGL